MTHDANDSLVPLLKSSDQIHLSMYLRRNSDLEDLKRQLLLCLEEAKRFLEPVLEPREREELLRPVRALAEDAAVLDKLTGNVGVFRTRSQFRVLGIPFELERSTHVASSFHVKPLLRWKQFDRDFLVVELDEEALHLYEGSQSSFRKIDSVLFSNRLTELFKRGDRLSFGEARELREEARKTFRWASAWMRQASPASRPRYFVTGPKPVVDRFLKFQKTGWKSDPCGVRFTSEKRLPEFLAQVRSLLREQAHRALERALLSFQAADPSHRIEGDLRRIAKAATEGRVRKLVIAENRSIFGKIERESGAISIHPFDRDHEDDDLLDDVAQLVLMAGGEVYLAKKEEIPRGRPILAMLADETQSERKQIRAARTSQDRGPFSRAQVGWTLA